jgi:hypothetical protein
VSSSAIKIIFSFNSTAQKLQAMTYANEIKIYHENDYETFQQVTF